MYFKLKYVEGAVPGGKRKAGAVTGGDKKESAREKSRNYEREGRKRVFLEKWKQGRDWLQFVDGAMTCKHCQLYYEKLNKPVQGHNSFIKGCTNLKVSAIVDHESSQTHKRAVEINVAKSTPETQSIAGKTFFALRHDCRHRIANLMRNTYAVVKHNRPLRDYVWLCDLDRTKGVDIGETYVNEKAALEFLSCIVEKERNDTKELIDSCPFFSFMMDGTTDISGDEQEAIYLRTSRNGQIEERLLCVGTPASTCSADLKEFVIQSFDDAKIDKDKLVGMGSDGASNMVGVKGGLAALLRAELNKEMINVHCFAHRLELAVRDVLKKVKLYDKLLTLIIGLHYFYIKQYKNKKGLQESIKAVGVKAILPPKVTGTRWLPHISRGIKSLLRTFKAYEAHLSTASHSNPKAEGLYKIMTSKELLCFALFLKDVLDPLMKLSLKLQQPESTIAECMVWLESTIESMEESKDSESDLVNEVLESGCFEGIKLSGKTPTMSYKTSILDGIKQAMQDRFLAASSNSKLVAATKLLHFQRWPLPGKDEINAFGIEELRAVAEHFDQTLKRARVDFNEDDLLKEWKLLKKLLYKTHGSNLPSMKWGELYSTYKEDFPNTMLVIDLLSCFPPTSVSCETTFSQLKLIKTCRRTRLSGTTLNNLLILKLSETGISEFNPEPAIDIFMSKGLQKRHTSYRRSVKVQGANKELEHPVAETEDDVNVQDVDADVNVQSDDEAIEENELDIETEVLNVLFEKDMDNDEFCEEFMGEEATWNSLSFFSRDE